MEDIKSLSFENAVSKLEDIINRLENGDVSLEESIKIYSQGIELKDHCLTKLNEAEEKVEKIIIKKDGSSEIEDFEKE